MPDQKLTAIVGDSGSGKSTILNLIAKYYEADGGTISIGGKPINHVAAERVLEQISMVDQDVFLFDDTIRENIRHARPNATDEEIEAACREANCDGFIRKMEKGYDTPTGENGNLLSGGERQRISIARAILKNSPILLLDEATASLDIENELAVKQAIANLLKEKKTVVMIAPVSYTHLLFHKVYACGMLAGIVLSTTKVSEFLSAMNRIHAPKKDVYKRQRP